jgi:hypothetical protein
VHATSAEPGWRAGVVELEADEMRGDDARHFAVWAGAAPRVQADPSAGPFVRTAVDALGQSQRVATGGDIIAATADVATRLPALLIAPTDPSRAGTANRTLERLGVPWRLGAVRREETGARGPRFDGVRVTLRYPLVAQAGAVADTLATAGGDAWIVAGKGYVLVGSPLDPSATDLPVRAGFVPWLGDVVAQRLAGDATTVVAGAPGQSIRLPAGTDGIEMPDGQVTRASGMARSPDRPGVYFLRTGAERIGALVVNPEAEESDLRRLSPSALRERVRGPAVTATADLATWRASLYASGSRRPLQVPLIVLALMLLAVEAWVLRRTERDAG